jgi:Ion channel
MQTARIPILAPLVVGVLVFACTTLVHALPLSATVNFVRQEKKRGRAGRNFWGDFTIVLRTISYVLAAHLVEMALWAGVLVMCGEFHDFGIAYYHSAVNYTTLGYGDIVMSPSWRLLGPLEGANGMLMFGVSTGVIFAVIQRLVEARFADLRE